MKAMPSATLRHLAEPERGILVRFMKGGGFGPRRTPAAEPDARRPPGWATQQHPHACADL